jgi:hypothetical protein
MHLKVRRWFPQRTFHRRSGRRFDIDLFGLSRLRHRHLQYAF